MAGRIYQVVLNLVVSLLSVRYLGPDNYGLINYAASFTALFTAFCTLGINDIIVNEFVTDPERQGKILGTAIIFRLFSSALSVATISLLAFMLNPNDSLAVWVTVVYSTSLLFQGFESINYWYQFKLLSKTTSIVTAVARTLVGIYKIMLLVMQKEAVWFAAANSVEYVAVGILLMLAYHRQRDKRQKLSFSFSLGKDLLSRSHHFILSGFMVALYAQMDRIMLKHMLSDSAVGYYSTAVTICALWNFVLVAIIDSAKPIILEAFKTDEALYKHRLTQLYSAIIFISMVAAAGISIFPKKIIFILYGVDYLPASSALRIVSWSTLFSYLGVARSIWVVPHGQQKYEKYLAGIGMFSNLTMNAIMIPLWGINGAAIATLLTQIITNCLSGYIFKPLRENNKLILSACDIRIYIRKMWQARKPT